LIIIFVRVFYSSSIALEFYFALKNFLLLKIIFICSFRYRDLIFSSQKSIYIYQLLLANIFQYGTSWENKGFLFMAFSETSVMKYNFLTSKGSSFS
jgi:hypothetical protein